MADEFANCAPDDLWRLRGPIGGRGYAEKRQGARSDVRGTRSYEDLPKLEATDAAETLRIGANRTGYASVAANGVGRQSSAEVPAEARSPSAPC